MQSYVTQLPPITCISQHLGVATASKVDATELKEESVLEAVETATLAAAGPNEDETGQQTSVVESEQDKLLGAVDVSNENTVSLATELTSTLTVEPSPAVEVELAAPSADDSEASLTFHETSTGGHVIGEENASEEAKTEKTADTTAGVTTSNSINEGDNCYVQVSAVEPLSNGNTTEGGGDSEESNLLSSQALPEPSAAPNQNAEGAPRIEIMRCASEDERGSCVTNITTEVVFEGTPLVAQTTEPQPEPKEEADFFTCISSVFKFW